MQNLRGFSFSQRRWWRFMSSGVLRISRRRNISEDLRLISACHGSGDRLSAFYRGDSGSMTGQFGWNVRRSSSNGRGFCMSTCGFPCQHHSTIAAASLIYNRSRCLILVSFNSTVDAAWFETLRQKLFIYGFLNDAVFYHIYYCTYYTRFCDRTLLNYLNRSKAKPMDIWYFCGDTNGVTSECSAVAIPLGQTCWYGKK